MNQHIDGRRTWLEKVPRIRNSWILWIFPNLAGHSWILGKEMKKEDSGRLFTIREKIQSIVNSRTAEEVEVGERKMDGNNRCKSTRKRRSMWFCWCLSKERERKTNDSEGHLCENRRQLQWRKHLPMHCDLQSIATIDLRLSVTHPQIRDRRFIRPTRVNLFLHNRMADIGMFFIDLMQKQQRFYQNTLVSHGHIDRSIADQSTIKQEIHINKTLKKRRLHCSRVDLQLIWTCTNGNHSLWFDTKYPSDLRWSDFSKWSC